MIYYINIFLLSEQDATDVVGDNKTLYLFWATNTLDDEVPSPSSHLNHVLKSLGLIWHWTHALFKSSILKFSFYSFTTYGFQFYDFTVFSFMISRFSVLWFYEFHDISVHFFIYNSCCQIYQTIPNLCNLYYSAQQNFTWKKHLDL